MPYEGEPVKSRTLLRGVVTAALASLVLGSGLVTAPAHAEDVITCGDTLDIRTDQPLEMTAGADFEPCQPDPTVDPNLNPDLTPALTLLGNAVDKATCTYYRGSTSRAAGSPARCAAICSPATSTTCGRLQSTSG